MFELPLVKMTVAEKLQVMEAHWESLSQNPNEVELPNWQGDVLKNRTERIEAGETTISSWAEAKRRLQDLG